MNRFPHFSPFRRTGRCSYGVCNSDSRYYHLDRMKDVFFVRFPTTDISKRRRWAILCGRKDFHITDVKQHTVICSKHFVGGNGPTLEHADPLPAAVR